MFGGENEELWSFGAELRCTFQVEGNTGNEPMMQVTTQTLSELYKTATDFNKLQERYDLQEEPTSRERDHVG